MLPDELSLRTYRTRRGAVLTDRDGRHVLLTVDDLAALCGDYWQRKFHDAWCELADEERVTLPEAPNDDHRTR